MQLCQANEQTNQVRHKGKLKGQIKRQIFLCFSENVLEVRERKTRGKWEIM